jgi:dGTPase
MASLRAFLYERMYKHYKVNRMRAQAKRILKELFEQFMADPATLPTPLRVRAERVGEFERARIVCDYIAGMTDNYAIEEHRRLFSFDSMS